MFKNEKLREPLPRHACIHCGRRGLAVMGLIEAVGTGKDRLAERETIGFFLKCSFCGLDFAACDGAVYRPQFFPQPEAAPRNNAGDLARLADEALARARRDGLRSPPESP